MTGITRRAAIHESGHAVATWLLWRKRGLWEPCFWLITVRTQRERKAGPLTDIDGEKVDCLGMLDGPPLYCPVNLENPGIYVPDLPFAPKLIERRRDLMSVAVMIMLAGPIAEARTTHRSRASVLAIGGEQDWKCANLLASDFARSPAERQEMLENLWTRAARLVRENWHIVVALAEALIERRSLTGPEALEIMREAGRGHNRPIHDRDAA